MKHDYSAAVRRIEGLNALAENARRNTESLPRGPSCHNFIWNKVYLVRKMVTRRLEERTCDAKAELYARRIKDKFAMPTFRLGEGYNALAESFGKAAQR